MIISEEEDSEFSTYSTLPFLVTCSTKAFAVRGFGTLVFLTLAEKLPCELVLVDDYA